MKATSALCLALALSACAGTAGRAGPVEHVAPAEHAGPEQPASRPTDIANDEAARAHPAPSGSAVPATAERPVESAFPPKDFAPPSAESARAGDGHWEPIGDAWLGERAAKEPRAVVRTVVHPHPESRFITVTVAAMDLSRLSIHQVIGTDDLTWAKLPVGTSSGLVPEADRTTLVLVMNGGFQPKHGRWGLSANGVVVTPPRKEGCTMALYSDGSVRLGPWPSLSDSAARMQSYRQTPPCILENDTVHPALVRGEDKAWAGHAADLTTRRRSALGIDASNTVLFYAIGEEASPRWLAEALKVAGANAAAELDINWYWTRFLVFGSEDGALRVTSTLIPKMEHGKTEYVERGSVRDFFYVREK